MKIIILAGGVGNRLWPYSNKNFPKQFLGFGRKKSLLQQTIARFMDLGKIYVVTSKEYEPLVKKQAPNVSVLAEPFQKNTAPAVCFALSNITCDNGETVFITPSDHIIENEEVFVEILLKEEKKLSSFGETERSKADNEQKVEDKSREKGESKDKELKIGDTEGAKSKEVEKDSIVLFGISPDKAEKDFGYIKKDGSTFIEKPSLELAKELISSKNYLFNSGMVLARKSTLLSEIKKYSPELLQGPNKGMQPVSLDKALLEKTKRIKVVPVDINWTDVGSFERLQQTQQTDNSKNVKIGQVSSTDLKNSLVISHNKKISIKGLEDVAVIDTEDCIYILKKEEKHSIESLLKGTT